MKRKARVLGISHGATPSSFQMVLVDEKYNRNIPIVIGTFEAQAISIEIEGVKTPRPLTHDIFAEFISKSGKILEEVYLYKFEEGIFYSKMIFDDGTVLDSRTTDAIIMALKMKSPIYVDSSVVSAAGISEGGGDEDDKELKEVDLNDSLKEAIENEDYEEANKIKKKLKELKKQ